MQLDLHYKSFSPTLLEEIGKFATSTNIDEEISKSVVEILDDVKDKGDQALLERTLLYDKANLNKSELRVPHEEIKKATTLLSSEQRYAINDAIENVTLFHQQNLPRNLN